MTSRDMPIGEIYCRMVRCLYSKFTLRKGIEYQDSKFIEMLKSLAKLALNGKAFLKRSDVLKEVGPDAFDYGLLMGHEDFRLIRNETADLLVSFRHRTILEFLWSFGFIFLLNEGKSIEHLLGIYDVLGDVLSKNPLFLNFGLWFLTTRETTFSFLAQDKIRDVLVRYTAGEIDRKSLNLRDIRGRYSALDQEVAQRDKNNILLTFLGDVLAQCRQTKYLVVGVEHLVDWVLTAVKDRFKSVKELTIQPRQEFQIWNKELERESASVNSWKSCLEMDLNIFFPSFYEIEKLKIVMKHCMSVRRLPCVHLALVRKSFDLSEILQKEMVGLHLGGWSGALACSQNLPVCPSLRHLSIMGFKVNEALVSALSTAIQNSRLPNLSHLSFSCSYFETGGFLSVLFQSECSSVQYLDLYDCKLSTNDIEFLTTVGAHAEKSVLPNLCSLKLSPRSCLRNEKSLETILSHPWPKLTSFTMGDLDLKFCTELVRLLNESKMPNLKVLRLSAKCKMERNDNDHWVVVEPGVNLNNLETDTLPHLESLTLYRMTNSVQELRSLEAKLMTWKLKDLDIGHSRNITGSLSILLCHDFPSLSTLRLRNCDLDLDDLSCIASARAQGRLPAIQYLDVSCSCHLVINPMQYLEYDPVTSEKVSWENVTIKSLG